MKKILIFSLAYYPQASGAEIAIKEITDRIASTDIEFHMLTLRFSVRDAYVEKIGNIQVYRLGNGSAYFSKVFFILRAALKARALHQTHHFDALWAMMSYMLIPIQLARWFGVRVPYALTLQEGDPFDYMFGRKAIRPFLPLLYKGFKEASVVQAISNFLATWAPRMGYTGKVEVIPNGFNIIMAPQAQALSALEERLGKRDGDIFLVTISRLVHKNAVDDILRALPQLPKHIKLLVVGGGTDEGMLKKLTQDLGLSSRTIFIGQVPNSETNNYLYISDIFIRPSRSEGMGNSFVSAMAVGLPVIATQEGGIADFLFDARRNPDKESTGWAVDKDSPIQIVAAVKEILEYPDQTKKVIDSARTLVLRNYNWDIITRNMRERVFGRMV